MSLEERIRLAEMKSRHQKQLRPWYKKPAGKIILVILLLLLIFATWALIYVYQQVKVIQKEQATAWQTSQEKLIATTLQGSGKYSLGSNNPKLTVVVFSDFACPYCKDFANTMRQAGEKYQQDVKIIFRSFPVISEKSIDLALAAHCAGAQGKFWEMHDLLFANQDPLANDTANLNANLISLATDLQLNADLMSSCLNDKILLNEISLNMENGETLGVDSTPTWFIGNNRGLGSIEASAFNKIIEDNLK